MLNYFASLSCRVTAVTIVAMAFAQGASAQMFEDPYRHNTIDRAGMAVVIKQVDEGMFNRSTATTSGASGSSTVLLCGGPDGGSTATSNSSCIILGDGASGLINLGQASDGDQDADATQNQTTNNTELSQALSTLAE